jgi:hypothetical protein
MRRKIQTEDLLLIVGCGIEGRRDSKAAHTAFCPPSVFSLMVSSNLPLASKPSSLQMQRKTGPRKGKKKKNKTPPAKLQKKKKNATEQTANRCVPKDHFPLQGQANKETPKNREQVKVQRRQKWYTSKTPSVRQLKLTNCSSQSSRCKSHLYSIHDLHSCHQDRTDFRWRLCPQKT